MNYITYLNIFSFIAIFIISFVFLYNNKTQLMSISILIIFLIFFMFYLLYLFTIYSKNTIYFVSGFSWLSLFSSITFKTISLILLFYTMNRLQIYDKDKNEMILSKKNKKIINDYYLMFIANMVLIFIILLVLLNYNNLNRELFYNLSYIFDENLSQSDAFIIYVQLFIILLCSITTISSFYEILFINKFSKNKMIKKI